ncbi:MAG TPA: cytosine permease [Actinomycetota bacterium]|nr:cytosine permease [Actinomycetota bacterium]
MKSALSAPPEWGVEPVPDRLRVLSTFDTGALWGNLGISLLLPIVAAFMVPAMSFRQALAAIAVGVVVGNLMLGYAGKIGAETGAPAMVLYRPALGLRGSYVPTLLNILQNVGWGSFELLIIGTAAAAISSEVFGVGLRPVWTVLFGALVTLMAVWGPLGVVRAWIRRYAVWLVLVATVYLTFEVLRRGGLGSALSAPATGGLPFWRGVDLVIAMPISWVPLVQDYTRFSRTPRAGFAGTALGYGIAHAWLYVLGALLVLSGLATNPTDPNAFVAAILAIPVFGILALGILAVDESDEAFANVYSASVSIQNVFPRVSQQKLSIGIGAVCTVIAMAVDLVQYESFLFLIGAVFVPLFGILAADYAVVARRYRPDDLWGPGPPVRAWAIVAWVAGFLAYNWINPGLISWWKGAMESLFDALRFPEAPSWLAASLVSFAVAFGLQSLKALRRDRSPAPAAASA